MEYLAEVLVIIAIIVVIAFLGKTIDGTANPINKRQELKRVYENTLIGNNKRAALDAARAYYSEFRENKALTVYDEQAIANDLSTMADQPVNTPIVNLTKM